VTRARSLALALVTLPVAGCVYYNAMWSAERLARDARRFAAQGQEAQAKLSWGRAAAKAESVLARHPRSGWADDALVLQGEGLARSGSCTAAARPLARALTVVSEEGLRERAAIAAAECMLVLGQPGDAGRLLVSVLGSQDGRRRSRAAYLAGQAALAHGDPTSAVDLFARSQMAEAGPARIRALLAAGRAEAATALVDSVARRNGDEAGWMEVMEELGRTVGATAAADALDRLLARGRLPVGARARLLLADGDRLQAEYFVDRAAARYDAVAALLPDSVESGRARLRGVLLQVTRLREPADLDSVAGRLHGLTPGLSGAALVESRVLRLQIEAIRSGDSSEMRAFRAAELARDSLAAPMLAASLFLRFATSHPASLFAPKALIAAGQLRPDAVDSVDRVLRSTYAESAYTLAFHGAASPAFRAAEDSLAIAFGVARPVMLGTVVGTRIAAPRPGPRGPDLEQPAGLAPRAAARPSPPRDRPSGRPSPRPPERPEDRP
jgi:hypothetical protein